MFGSDSGEGGDWCRRIDLLGDVAEPGRLRVALLKSESTEDADEGGDASQEKSPAAFNTSYTSSASDLQPPSSPKRKRERRYHSRQFNAKMASDSSVGGDGDQSSPDDDDASPGQGDSPELVAWSFGGLRELNSTTDPWSVVDIRDLVLPNGASADTHDPRFIMSTSDDNDENLHGENDDESENFGIRTYVGKHWFAVAAVDASGNVDRSAGVDLGGRSPHAVPSASTWQWSVNVGSVRTLMDSRPARRADSSSALFRVSCATAGLVDHPLPGQAPAAVSASVSGSSGGASEDGTAGEAGGGSAPTGSIGCFYRYVLVVGVATGATRRRPPELSTGICSMTSPRP